MSTPSSASLHPASQPPYTVDLCAYYTCNNAALVQVKASDDASGPDHVPSSVVLVIDVSGSMASPASMHDDSDGASGLSQLDIVKHASRTILESLHEDDQIAVVAFASQVRIVFPLATMTPNNRREAWKAVDGLRPASCTNLYGGLIRALDMIKDHDEMPSNPSIMLLTDGMPNISPPRGEIQSLRNYLDANPLLNQVRIATFGFGYQLDSQLLADIATLGRSLYAFIPDASFVGTVFVNAVSNVLASASTSQMTLKLEAADGVTLTGITSGQSFQKTHWGLSVELPSLLYGQTLEVLVQTSGDQSKEPFQAFLESKDLEESLEVSPCYIDAMDSEEAYLCRAQVRSELIQCIRQAGRCSSDEDLKKGQVRVAEARQRVAELGSKSSSTEVEKMKQDLDGQITEAYSRLDWHKRWGGHFTLSLASAHSLQQCSNFKDPGVEHYATAKFSLIRDASEAKFVELPPPKPSRTVYKEVSSMRTYYCSSTPCFASGLVRMADGTRVSITDIKAGFLLDSPNGPVGVRCVVETPVPVGTAGLVDLGQNVRVTPWHPVRPAGGGGLGWKYPYEVATPRWLSCTSVFSLVLEDGGSVFRIGDHDAVALGHGLVDPVAAHDYLGTELVLNDLSGMEGWAAGHVTLPVDPVLRDPVTSLIVGFKSNTTTETAA